MAPVCFLREKWLCGLLRRRKIVRKKRSRKHCFRVEKDEVDDEYVILELEGEEEANVV